MKKIKIEIAKYRLINYFDVWGNEKDGWEINNWCEEFDDLNISDDSTEKEIATFLKNTGYLNTDDMRQLAIENYGDMIEIYERKGMKPIGRLELMEGV